MTALATDRNTARMEGGERLLDVAEAVKIYAGSLVMRDANGNATPGVAATGGQGAGRAEEQVDNSDGAAGDLTVRVKSGVYRFANSSSGDAITKADIGAMAFIVDDQTVAKTSNSGTRSPAGVITGVDTLGVWVDFDEAKIAAWKLARKKIVQLRLSTIAGAGSPVYRVVSPWSGLITKITSIIELALTTGDAVLTAKIGAVAITGGAITVAQAGSAAGDIDSALPSAANYVAAGNMLSITVTGTQAAAAPANVTFEIDAD